MISGDKKLPVSLIVGVAIGLIAAVMFLLVFLAFADGAREVVSPPVFGFFKDILGPVAAGFGGAIAGSLVSHYVRLEAESRRDFDDLVKSYNIAIGIVAAKLNDLASIKRTTVLPYALSPLRFMEIPAIPHGDSVKERADVLLTNLLLSLEKPDLYMSLVQVENRYQACIVNMHERSKFVMDYRQRADEHPAGNVSHISLSDIVKINGIARTIRLYTFTEQHLTLLDETITEMVSLLVELNKACGERLKGRGMRVMRIDTPGDESFAPIPSPYFASVNDLAGVISEQIDPTVLSGRDWMLYPYDKRRM